MSEISINILNDNSPGKVCGSEHGLSYLITVNDIQVLFDVGPSDIAFKNANRLGIPLKQVKTIVLSHGHWDHGNGLIHAEGVPLICHSSCFKKRFRKSDMSYVGLLPDKAEIEKRYYLIISDGPYKISENIFFLGGIPRITSFESKKTSFIDENKKNDFVEDDTGLAIITKKGLVIITGCAHSGLCNTIKQAKFVTGISKVYGVIGGFHLKQNNEITQKTIAYLKREKVEKVYPGHCTELPALARFHKSFGSPQLKSGDTIEF